MIDYGKLTHSPKGWAILAGIVFMILMTNACHEGGHALVAWWCGDRRESIRRRATLNPVVHFHWFLTLVLPALSIWLFGWAMGGARPVLIDLGRIGPRRMALACLAGPLGNFLFCGFVIALFGLAVSFEWIDPFNPIRSPAWMVMKPAVWFSAFLGLSNLIPIPPLDGSRIIAPLLPEPIRSIWYRAGPVGIILVLFLMLWVSGQLASWGLGPGHPEIFITIDEKVEDYLFAMVSFWEAL